jgi:hypothetical protein
MKYLFQFCVCSVIAIFVCAALAQSPKIAAPPSVPPEMAGTWATSDNKGWLAIRADGLCSCGGEVGVVGIITSVSKNTLSLELRPSPGETPKGQKDPKITITYDPKALTMTLSPEGRGDSLVYKRLGDKSWLEDAKIPLSSVPPKQNP